MVDERIPEWKDHDGLRVPTLRPHAGQKTQRPLHGMLPEEKPMISYDPKKERLRYEIYQSIMAFLVEYLPSKGYHVSKTVEEDSESYVEYLEGHTRENFVGDYLQLPTVQEDRKKADDLVREIQKRANQK